MTALQQKEEAVAADQQALGIALQLTLQQGGGAEGGAAALLDYLLAALPHQRGETGALAAHMLLTSLLGAAQPAATLQAGGALLHHYLAEDLTKVVCPSKPLS